MFLISIILSGLIIGLLASAIKKRFSTWVFILIALIGALVGGFISFGDSTFLLAYPMFNIWTVPVLGALLFSGLVIFADRRKIVAAIATALIIIAAVFGLVYSDGAQTNLAPFFSEELQRAGIERVGHPIEGFSAQMYLEAFPGFIASDFNDVESLEGVYKIENGEITYKRIAPLPATSAEDVISEAGYKTLLENFAERVGVRVATEADITTILEKLREGDIEQESYIHEDFSIWHPEGWYAHENTTGVIFTKNEDLEMPKNTEGFALGPQFQVIVQNMSAEDLFEQNLWTDGSEFLISKEPTRIKTEEGARIVTEAAGTSGEVLHYVLESKDGRVFTLAHYPYERGSSDTDDFEQAVQTFMINYTIDGTTNGNGLTGILPFKSGVEGRVLLGPTCPVQKDPPDPNCADKGHATTVQVIEKNSPKSSLFSSVETDKEGNYKVMLPPGEFRLQALGGQPFPRCEWQTVTIKPDTMIKVDLLCDTGIR